MSVALVVAILFVAVPSTEAALSTQIPDADGSFLDRAVQVVWSWFEPAPAEPSDDALADGDIGPSTQEAHRTFGEAGSN